MEWKVVSIGFMDVGKSRDRELRAKTLSELCVDQVLGQKGKEKGYASAPEFCSER